MYLVDANVLLYATNGDASQHDEARDWLEGALNGSTTVGFSWVALLAYLRIVTKIDLLPAPLSVDEATEVVRSWLDQDQSVVLQPTVRHFDVLTGLLQEVGTGGNLTTDAHLATLAIEHGATIVSFDNDFDRFAGVRWTRPRDAAL